MSSDYKDKLIQNGARIRKGIEVVLPEPSLDKKLKIRKQFKAEIGDSDDLLADVSKMVSLLTSTMGRIYSTLSATQKSKIPQAERDLIEYLFVQKSLTTTTGDIDFAKDPYGTIDKLLNREKLKVEIKQRIAR